MFEQALCKQIGLESFTQGWDNHLTNKQIEQATSVCMRCPERVECLADAERYKESGVIRGAKYFKVTGLNAAPETDRELTFDSAMRAMIK